MTLLINSTLSTKDYLCEEICVSTVELIKQGLTSEIILFKTTCFATVTF